MATPTSPPPVKVLLADDDALVRSGFKVLLDLEDHITVVGEAGTGAEAVEQARATRPDTVLMPQLDGAAMHLSPATARTHELQTASLGLSRRGQQPFRVFYRHVVGVGDIEIQPRDKRPPVGQDSGCGGVRILDARYVRDSLQLPEQRLMSRQRSSRRRRRRVLRQRMPRATQICVARTVPGHASRRG